MESRRRGLAAMGSDYGTREIFDCERVFFLTYVFYQKKAVIFQIKWR